METSLVGMVAGACNVFPAIQEAEAGESLEPGGGDCGKLRSWHCTADWATRTKLHLK